MERIDSDNIGDYLDRIITLYQQFQDGIRKGDKADETIIEDMRREHGRAIIVNKRALDELPKSGPLSNNQALMISTNCSLLQTMQLTISRAERKLWPEKEEHKLSDENKPTEGAPQNPGSFSSAIARIFGTDTSKPATGSDLSATRRRINPIRQNVEVNEGNITAPNFQGGSNMTAVIRQSINGGEELSIRNMKSTTPSNLLSDLQSATDGNTYYRDFNGLTSATALSDTADYNIGTTEANQLYSNNPAASLFGNLFKRGSASDTQVGQGPNRKTATSDSSVHKRRHRKTQQTNEIGRANVMADETVGSTNQTGGMCGLAPDNGSDNGSSFTETVEYTGDKFDVKKPTLVNYWGSWCPASVAFLPTWKEFKKKAAESYPDLQVTDLNIAKGDSKLGKIASKIGVHGFPTLVLFYNGKTYSKPAGSIRGLSEISDFVNKILV